MDGATKIVKGDAIMSIIITSINFIAGSIIGIVQSGMGLSEVLSVYSIATIGDGLVSQLPALMISTATGMIVTRAVSEGSLNNDVIKQFLAQPQSLMIAGLILAVFAIFPGTPHIQLILVAAALILISRRVAHQMEVLQKEKEALPAAQEAAQKQAEAQQSEMDYYKDVNNIYSLINVEPIEMEFGYSLIPLVDESRGGKLISRIVIFRRQYAQDMGFVVPSIRLRDASPTNMSSRLRAKKWPAVKFCWIITLRWSLPIRRVKLMASKPLNPRMAFLPGGFCRKTRKWPRFMDIRLLIRCLLC